MVRNAAGLSPAKWFRTKGTAVASEQTSGHREAVSLCAEHDRQLGGESPLSNLMEVKD
jgi:hypothetical protein